MAYWTSSSGRIELDIKRTHARTATHSGPCDADIAALSVRPYIARQLRKIDPAALSAELAGYGAWDDEERADHAQNLQRVLWIACGDLAEGSQ